MVLTPLPKELMIFLPFAALVYFFLRNPLKAILERTIVFIIVAILYVIVYLIVFSGDYYILNFLVATMFYGSFISLFILKRPTKLDSNFKKRIDGFVEKVIVIEALVGVLQVLMLGQGFDLSSGDYVQGTINPLSFLNNDNGFANIFYTINQVSLLTYYTLLSQKRKKLVIFLGCLSIFLASCIHITISIILAAGVTLSIINMVKVAKVVGLILIFIGVLYFIAPRNLASFVSYKQQIVESRNLKVKSTVSSIPLLFSSPKIFLFGYGLGQYGSRSSLIMSGKYFYDKQNKRFTNPVQIENTNPDMEKVLMPLWVAGTTNMEYGLSVMNRPVYSIQSLIMELGPILFSVLALAVISIVIRLRRKYIKVPDKTEKMRMLYLITIIFFVVFIGMFENYLEIAQGIFPTVLLFKILSYKSSS
ncbi:hypothetical protein [Flagellimonas sp. GZD32]|uniref:hypothetical protein n=1 Tax=Flagellimonas cixiensis TaxID=3228750 RepID=UPI0035C8E6BE